MLALAALAAALSITNIQPIALHPGVNIVPNFTPEGAPVTIVQGWRGNGNAHSHAVWMVLAREAEGMAEGVIGLQPAQGPLHETIDDDPFDGERTLGVIRFARARLDGAPATILIDAHLDEAPRGVLADHATATITVYRLVRTDGAPGTTPLVFEPASVVHTTHRFCNVEPALHEALGLPLSPDYGGANPVDGCAR